MELLGVTFWVGDGELISSHLFLVDRSLLNGSRAISSKFGLFSQVAADASVIGHFWVDALNINRFPFRQRLDLMGQSLAKQGFHLILGI